MQRAIETRYKQRLFRSRLEARYAVLFDNLEIRWDYEPEGFDLGHGLWYLPDFFLHLPDAQKPGHGYWVEIKGRAPTDDERRKLALLTQQTGHTGWMFCGSPGEGTVYLCSRDGTFSAQPFTGGLAWAAPLLLCSTLSAERFQPAVPKAIERALSARFEFGARP